MVKTNKKNKIVEEDLEKPADLDTIRTSMIFKREQFRKLKVESAEKDTTMANIVRGLLDNHFNVDDDEIRENVEDNLDDILKNIGGFWGGFKVDKFVSKMSDVDIEFSHLKASEWRSVLTKIEEGGLDGSDNAGDFVERFDELNPNRKQRKDLRSLARKLIKKEKDW